MLFLSKLLNNQVGISGLGPKGCGLESLSYPFCLQKEVESDYNHILGLNPEMQVGDGLGRWVRSLLLLFKKVQFYIPWFKSTTLGGTMWTLVLQSISLNLHIICCTHLDAPSEP